jgi:hypothetical protein
VLCGSLFRTAPALTAGAVRTAAEVQSLDQPLIEAATEFRRLQIEIEELLIEL